MARIVVSTCRVRARRGRPDLHLRGGTFPSQKALAATGVDPNTVCATCPNPM